MDHLSQGVPVVEDLDMTSLKHRGSAPAVDDDPDPTERKPPAPVYRVRFSRLALGTVSLPLGALISCLTLSFFLHFERSTYTHCRVWNFAPSISASIGVLSPQRYIWKMCLALHAAPRILLAMLYRNRLSGSLGPRHGTGVTVSFVTNVIENLALLMLSFAPSKESFRLHQLSFITFLVSSILYMMLSFRLWTKVEKKSDQGHDVKKKMLVMNLVSTVLALYLYYRHNRYCEPGVYSLFSIGEYAIVLSNIGFHFASYYDFYDTALTVM